MTALSLGITAAPARVPRRSQPAAQCRAVSPPGSRRPPRGFPVAAGQSGVSVLSAAVQPTPPPVGALHATVRGRRVLLGTAVLALAGLGLLGGQADASSSAVAPATVTVAVAPGDTLWEFATELDRSGEDLRDVVREIQRLNGMGSADLRAGDLIQLPAA